MKNCRKFSLHFQGAPKVYLEETTFYLLARVIIGTSLYRTLMSVCLSVFKEEPALIFPSDIWLCSYSQSELEVPVMDIELSIGGADKKLLSTQTE